MPALLQLNSYHYRRGGSDAVYLDHEAMFADMGWRTAHMAMHHPKNLPSPWSPYFVDELEFGHEYSVPQKIAMAGKTIYSFEARRKLGRLLDDFRPDIAHAHCIYHHLSPSVLPLLRERGVPVVLTAHDLKIACPAYKMLNRGGVCERCKGGNLLHMVARRCVRDSLAVSALVAVESTVARSLGLYRNNIDRVVVPSRFYEQKLIEWGWPAQRLAYIPNYVNGLRHEPNYQPGKYFLYFGRLAPEKGVGTLIRAARAAGVHLKIAGTGPLEVELRAMAAGASNIEFVGFCGGEKLWQLVRESRAVVLPSEWYENAPMSVLEAYALGKPVIGARMGGIPEMVIPGQTGLVFESGHVEHLREALLRLQRMPAQGVAEWGRFARRHVLQEYSEARYRNSMLRLYAELGRF